MKRPTLTLTLIAKNEEHNLEPLFESIRLCFDEIVLVDTGSTDNTVEKAKALGMRVEHFSWVNDFAAARNYALQFVNTDYWMWMDLDDALSDPAAFILWRDNAMAFADCHYATYHYAFDETRKPTCSFLRERVLRTSCGAKWLDFIHESVNCQNMSATIAGSWSINHRRSLDEMLGDRGRNLQMLEARKDELKPRLMFYYGKELHDGGRHLDAIYVLREGLKSKTLELHDRLLGLQFLINSLLAKDECVEAIQYGLIALQLAPNRAEIHCLIGDCYLKLNQLVNAVPHYSAALACKNINTQGQSTVFTANDCYNSYPRTQLAKIYFQSGEFEQSLKSLEPLDDKDSMLLKLECEKAIQLTKLGCGQVDTDDIVISGTPQQAYAWDELIYSERGVGGSETACIEMAAQLKRLTGRPVIVFNVREQTLVAPSGVEYRPIKTIHSYFQKYRPAVHFAWRHSVRLTDAPSYVWCHDLLTMSAELTENYDKILCLSEFHKRYVMAIQNVPSEKILITRNGIEPRRFSAVAPNLVYKVIWPNSPDRGLVQAMLIMDLVVQRLPEAELHVFYGFSNMQAAGQEHLVKKLEEMIQARPYVKYHGNVDQTLLAKEMQSSGVWLYCATFIETFCITALESIAARCWPVVRDIGALPDTLAEAHMRSQCDLLDVDPCTETGRREYADKVIDAILKEKWKTIDIGLEQSSWNSVAQDWVREFNL